MLQSRKVAKDSAQTAPRHVTGFDVGPPPLTLRLHFPQRPTMDVQQVSEVLKGIGHRAFNITDALSNPSLTDNKRIEYIAHRIQWGLERKIILVVQANEYTAPLLFPTGFRNASAGVNIFLIAKHGELLLIQVLQRLSHLLVDTHSSVVSLLFFHHACKG